ncbi:MAG: PAAR-like domain-containing protein [Planctomycetota bacterium]|nr:PAAR-like domain-containing protein [Planctomycetota bacterium]
MSHEVYANNMAVSCKSGSGKSICAMPDVCLTPPPPPAGPIPIPYPNTGMASDTSSGSKDVKIKGKEVMLKDKSFFKKSMGDEAATKSQSMNVITHQIQGKCYFKAWSMDVKIEGENAVRHLDIMTHNHASEVGGTPPWPETEGMAAGGVDPCADSKAREASACAPPGSAPRADGNGVDCSPACKEARDCRLPKYKDAKKVCCHPNTTGDHLIEVNCFTQSGGRSGLNVGSYETLDAIPNFGYDFAAPKTRPRRLSGFEDYNEDNAPTACANRDGSSGKHGAMQAARDRVKRQCRNAARGVPLDIFITGEQSFWTYGQASKAGAKSHKQANPQCDEECTKAQLDSYHHQVLPGDTAAAKNAVPVRTYIPKK